MKKEDRQLKKKFNSKTCCILKKKKKNPVHFIHSHNLANTVEIYLIDSTIWMMKLNHGGMHTLVELFLRAVSPTFSDFLRN